VATKKFDPLWEIVGEKIALQDVDSGVESPCPHCGVPLHLGPSVLKGRRVTCGLCGGVSEVGETGAGLALKREGRETQ
jgi:hypothetical protein